MSWFFSPAACPRTCGSRDAVGRRSPKRFPSCPENGWLSGVLLKPGILDKVYVLNVLGASWMGEIRNRQRRVPLPGDVDSPKIFFTLSTASLKYSHLSFQSVGRYFRPTPTYPLHSCRVHDNARISRVQRAEALPQVSLRSSAAILHVDLQDGSCFRESGLPLSCSLWEGPRI